jgi:hypothetical protein
MTVELLIFLHPFQEQSQLPGFFLKNRIKSFFVKQIFQGKSKKKNIGF